MDFLELARERYSVRSFQDKPVASGDMDKILEAGRLAPTACNKQPQRVIVIDDAASLTKLRRVTQCHFNAPAALIVCHDTSECWVRPFDGKKSGDIDASIVAAHMMLEAASIGVGTTWVMFFIPEAVRAEFELPDNYEPTAILVMGYPAPDARPASQHEKSRPMDELVFRGGF